MSTAHPRASAWHLRGAGGAELWIDADGYLADGPVAGAVAVDCGGATLEPGRVCAHTHLYSGLASFGMPPPVKRPEHFIEILERIWWRLDRVLDAPALVAGARWAVAEALLAGTTTLIDHHESPNLIAGSLDLLAEVFDELGARGALCYGATERNGGLAEGRAGLAECARFVRANRRPRVRGLVGLHAAFTVSDTLIEEAAALASELAVPVHVHVAEGVADVQHARALGYRGPLERLRTLGALPPGSLAIHGVHLTPQQVASAPHIWWVQNPRSNQGNGVGYPHGLVGAEGRVALGTDGYPAQMDAELAELRELDDDPAVGPRRLAAGRALISELFDEDISGLTPGAVADVVARDPDGRARHVWVAGAQVVRDGALLTGDLGALRADAEAQAIRLWDRMAVMEEME
ncbi:MAG: amidohydrolase family protein [Myxococcales bacterium]|nr:amidohydrolase family protein [Myxococcales bacterium]